MSGAHIGGSRAYGTPRENSDVDLVVLVTLPEAYILGNNADEPNEPRGERKSFPVRYGRLNLIVCFEQETYDRWLSGKVRLQERARDGAKVSREDAIAMFNALGVSGDYEPPEKEREAMPELFRAPLCLPPPNEERGRS